MLDLKTLRALALATQEFNSGEWMACGPSFGAPKPAYLDEVVAMDGEDEDCRICAAPEWSEEHFAERSANMEFIAAANPAVILALIERLEAAEAAPLPAEQPINPAPRDVDAPIVLPEKPEPDITYEDGKDEWGYTAHSCAHSDDALTTYATAAVQNDRADQKGQEK